MTAALVWWLCLLFVLISATAQGETIPRQLFTTSVPNSIYLECGGIIDVPLNGEAVHLHYRSTQAQSFQSYNNERCLWTFNNEIGVFKYILIANFELLNSDLESSDGAVAVLNWNRTSGLESKLLNQGKAMGPIAAEGLYISFTNDGPAQGPGTETGFTVKVELNKIEERSILGRNWHFSEPTGIQTYGYYRNNERVSIAVNPISTSSQCKTIDFTVDYVYTEGPNCIYDHLDIYEIGPSGLPTKYARLCGSIETPTLVISTNNTVLALFASDSVHNGEGFQVSWNAKDFIYN